MRMGRIPGTFSYVALGFSAFWRSSAARFVRYDGGQNWLVFVFVFGRGVGISSSK
jgi:hypothetical protein